MIHYQYLCKSNKFFILQKSVKNCCTASTAYHFENIDNDFQVTTSEKMVYYVTIST